MPIIKIGLNTGDHYGGAESNWIESTANATNRSTATTIVTGIDFFETVDAFGVFKFPIPDVLVGETINSVKLFLHRRNDGYTEGDGLDINVYRIIPATVMSEMNSNVRSTGNNWNTTGAQGAGTDRDTTSSSSLTNIPGGGTADWREFPSSAKFITDVEDAIDDFLTLLVQPVDGVYQVNWDSATTGTDDGLRAYLEIDYTEGGGTPPALTDVNTTETFASDDTTVPFTGTDMGADETERTAKLIQGATEMLLAQGTGDATSGEFDPSEHYEAGGLGRYGAGEIEIETAEGADTLAVTVTVPTGKSVVTIVTPAADLDWRVEADPEPLPADAQVRYDSLTSLGDALEIDDDGSLIQEDGSYAVDPVSFTPVTGASLSSTVTSDPVELAGDMVATFEYDIQDDTGWGTPANGSISFQATISVADGEWRKNAGSWTSSPGFGVLGDEVEVRGTSSGAPSTETVVTLTIDGDDYEFSITTAAEDTTPDAFSFTDQTGVELSTVCTSAPITVAGLGTGVSSAISVSGGLYSINGGSYTSSPGTVINGDLVRARVTSSGSYSTAATATVTIGGVSDGFSATTRAQVAPTIITTTLASGYVSTPYNRTIVATGDGPFTWAVDSGVLPDGLSLNSGTGAITGTPTTEETQAFTIEATNAAGSDTQALSITIGAELVIGTAGVATRSSLRSSLGSSLAAWR